jgi:hypothetical protein
LEEGAERTLERGTAQRLDACAVEGLVDRRMSGEGVHESHEVGRAEKAQATVAVVVGERTERLGTKRDVGMQLVGPGGVDRSETRP